MKRILFITVFCGWAGVGYSQSFAQMLETMLQQISALEGYIKTAEKGYQIAQQGLNTISEIKNGEFNLHSAFFSSLKTVSPAVSNMAEVGEILALEASMVERASQVSQFAKQSKWLGPSEVSYISTTYSALLSASLKNVNALLDVITSGSLEMTDGDRIKRIQALDTDSRARYGIVQNFSSQTSLLTIQRESEFETIGGIQSLYGIP